VHYDWFNGNIGLVEAGADGIVQKQTYLTPVATLPRGENYHPEIVASPTPTGITAALNSIGFVVPEHFLAKFEMQTILTQHN